MKSNFLIIWAIAVLISISNSSGEITQAEAERFSKKLKFDSVQCFSEVRTQFKARTNAVEYLKNYLEEKTLQTQVSGKLEKIMPEIEATLRANPADCALVSVTVDSATNKVYQVRAVRLEGAGDDAVQVLAPHVFTSSQFGSLTNGPAEGFNYDTNLSHLICFGLDEGEIKAAPVFLPDLRSTLVAAVQDMQKSEAAAPRRPLPPTGLRIISP